ARARGEVHALLDVRELLLGEGVTVVVHDGHLGGVVDHPLAVGQLPGNPVPARSLRHEGRVRDAHAPGPTSFFRNILSAFVRSRSRASATAFSSVQRLETT